MNVMAVPSRQLCDLLVANWTESVLLFPQMEQPAFSFERLSHVNVKTFFIVALPRWVIGVRLCFDFRVPLNEHVGCFRKVIFLTFHFSEEDPVVLPDGLEVFLRDSGAR